jgi:tol-pal system protein YbgF
MTVLFSKRNKQNHKTGLLLIGGVLFVSFVLMQSASAGYTQSTNNDTTALMNRINQLENQVQTMSRAVYRGDKSGAPLSGSADNSVEAMPLTGAGSSYDSGSAAANYEVRISQIEDQQRKLTGEIEKNTNDIQQMKDRFDKMQADTEQRLQQLEHSGALVRDDKALPLEKSPPQPRAESRKSESDTEKEEGSLSGGTLGTLHSESAKDAAEAGTTGQEGADALYEEAFASVRAAKYDDAESKFKKFMTNYPDHALAGNAQYWLSETYYVRGDYKQSAKMFAQGYQSFPKSPKAADSLLKMGLSLSKLGKNEDACLSFKQLQKQFPGDTSPAARRASQEMKSLGCS